MADTAEAEDDQQVQLRKVVQENEALWKRAQDVAGVPSAKERDEQLAEAAKKRAAAEVPYRKSLQTIGAMQDDILANLPALKETEPPKYQDFKPPPEVKRQNPMLAFQNAGTIFALAASGLSRRPLTAAFSAAAGAMEGFEAGDTQRIKDQLDAWKRENDTIKDQNDVETRRFNAIVNAKGLSYNERVQRISLLNQITQNKTAQYALETGGIEAAEQVYQQKNKYALDLYKAWEAGNNHLRDDLAKQVENKLKREDLKQKLAQQAEEKEKDRQNKLQIAKEKANKGSLKDEEARDNAVRNIDESLDFLEDGLSGKGPRVSGWAGWWNRAVATGKSVIGADYETAPHEFQQRLLLLKTTLPRLLAATSRVTVSEREEMQQILGGLVAGTPPEVVKKDLMHLRGMIDRVAKRGEGEETKAPAAPTAQPATPTADTPPASMLKEGIITTFSNGQKWTLRDGKPVRAD